MFVWFMFGCRRTAMNQSENFCDLWQPAGLDFSLAPVPSFNNIQTYLNRRMANLHWIRATGLRWKSICWCWCVCVWFFSHGYLFVCFRVGWSHWLLLSVRIGFAVHLLLSWVAETTQHFNVFQCKSHPIILAVCFPRCFGNWVTELPFSLL